MIAEAAAERCGRAYRRPDHYWTVCPHTTKAQTPSDAPRIYAKDRRAAGRRWRATMFAFTEAWREALVTWINGGQACFPECGWVPYGACYSGSHPQRESA